MKAISLTQPWASLVAIGAKRIETRSWSTSYRGPLAIHAAKGYSKTALKLANVEPLRNALTHAGLDPLGLPRGIIVATCQLVECYPIPGERRLMRHPALDYFNIGVWLPPFEPELSFGDYATGRYAWLLHNVQPLAEPIPARGALGLWDWTPPAP